MNEAEEVEPTAIPDPDADDELRVEAERFGIDPDVYADLTKRERALMKARATKRLKAEASRYGVDFEEYLDLSEEDREAVRERAKSRALRHVDKGSNGSDVYTARDEAPAREADPAKRDKMTIGDIELDPALDRAELTELQRTPPATLMDIYARWPVGDPDGRYRLRVERVQPKVYQNIAVAGYVGEIKTPISEAQFQAYFGGREYDITLYGPDPSGKHDSVTGLPKIVRLTKPFRITVPLLPPNLGVLPAALPEQEDAMINPYAAPVAPPATAADAQMHKVNVDFMQSTIKMQREDQEKREQQEAKGQEKLVDVLREQHREVLQTERDNAARREKALEEEKKELRSRLERLERELEGATGKRGVEAIDLLKHTKSTEADAVKATSDMYSKQIDSLRETHAESMARLRDSQEEMVRTLKSQHEQEIKRLEARLTEQETYYGRQINDMRIKHDDREKQLKDEVDRVRREERDAAAERLREQRERFDDRIKDLEASHRRENASLKESVETRKEVSEAQLKMEIASLKERVEELKEQLETARSEAEENKDPVAVIAKAREQAEKLGYKEDKDKPTMFESFMSAAGPGVGQFLAEAPKWLPQVAASMRAPQPQQQQRGQLGQMPGQLGPGQQQQRPAVSWSSEGEPAAARPPVSPTGELGFQRPAGEAAPQTAAAPAAAQAPTPASAPAPAPAPAAPSPQEAQAAPPAPAMPDNIFREVFSDNEIVGFLQHVEMGINGSMEPEAFAKMFVTRAPVEADKLVKSFTKNDFTRFVESFPGAEGSPILRRDGTRWIEEMLASVKKLIGKGKAAA